MNFYEAKQEARKERYMALAEKKQAEGSSVLEYARKQLEVIPMGQPILVGHHSEKGHRAHLKRIDNAYRKGFGLQDTAKYYEHKAESVGKGGISQDDPDAIIKLKNRLEELQRKQEFMKAVNKTHAQYLKNPSSLEKSELSDSAKNLIRTYKPAYSWEPHPFAPYQFQNNNGNMARIKERITLLEKMEAQKAVESEVKEYDGFKVFEEDGRIQFEFPGKPADDVRACLKSNGFKWSPSRGTWVRFALNGQWQKERVIAFLTK